MIKADPHPPSTTVAAEAGDLTTGTGRHPRMAAASASIEGTMTGSLPSTMTAASTSEEAGEDLFLSTTTAASTSKEAREEDSPSTTAAASTSKEAGEEDPPSTTTAASTRLETEEGEGEEEWEEDTPAAAAGVWASLTTAGATSSDAGTTAPQEAATARATEKPETRPLDVCVGTREQKPCDLVLRSACLPRRVPWTFSLEPKGCDNVSGTVNHLVGLSCDYACTSCEGAH